MKGVEVRGAEAHNPDWLDQLKTDKMRKQCQQPAATLTTSVIKEEVRHHFGAPKLQRTAISPTQSEVIYACMCRD